MPTHTNQSLIYKLKQIVGTHNVITESSKIDAFCNGFRYGHGQALAVVKPALLREQWEILKVCIESNLIVIMQAANTGLTGGSTPNGKDYDREIVIIHTMRMNKIYLLPNAEQVICLPGSTLNQLEKKLKPFGKEPHSVIGSSCIGASVFGGICNNSGGALIQRGPAYTEMALYAQCTSEGHLELINHLGINLGNTPEEILDRLDKEQFTYQDIQSANKDCSNTHYMEAVQNIEANSPARFNADPTHLHEASGCAGKLAVFAVRLDTFPKEDKTQVFYIGTNIPNTLSQIRRNILSQGIIPISGEYIHRDAYKIAAIYGKDTFLFIQFLGTNLIPTLFAFKNQFDRFFKKLCVFPSHLSDWLMQAFSHLFPQHLPIRMNQYAEKYEHHLLLKVGEKDIEPIRNFLQHFFSKEPLGDFFECTKKEGEKAFLHRFAVANAAVRYRAVHPKTVEDILALDIALRRNDQNWVEDLLPEDIEQACINKLYYGHFFCHVFHQDYIIRKGYKIDSLEEKMLTILEHRGAEYPAEHNVGHLYSAKEKLREFYKQLDPCNVFNPGIGKTSKWKNWMEKA